MTHIGPTRNRRQKKWSGVMASVSGPCVMGTSVCQKCHKKW